MPTRAYPIVDKTAGQQAIARIWERRKTTTSLRDLSLEDCEADPLALLRLIITSQRGVPEWIVTEDVLDGLWVLSYVRQHLPHVPAVLDRFEYELVELGGRMRMPQIQMAAPLGLRSRQAVANLIGRHRAAKLGLPRSERAERNHRLRAAARSTTNQDEAAWFDRHALPLWEAAAQLAQLRRTFDYLIDDDLAEDLMHLRSAVREMTWPLTPTQFPTLREISWWVRSILEDLEADSYAAFRAEVGDLLLVLADLSSRHYAVLNRG
jgi:hypothetical protein